MTNAAHFNPVFSGNPYNPMSILITNVTVDNLNLDSGDEIGVFDGDKCVGSASYDENNMIGISVSMADPTSSEVDGFKINDPIYFKIWKQKMDFEYVYVQTHFDASLDTIFRALGTAFVELKAYISQQKPRIFPNQTFSVSDNAAQNAVLGTVEVNFPQGNLHFELLHQGQNNPFTIDSTTGTISITDPTLLSYNDSLKYHLSIRAYSEKNVVLTDTSFCIVNIERTPKISSLRNDTAYVGLLYKKTAKINNPSGKELTIVPTSVPSWLTLDLKSNQEITFEGIPSNQDVGESEISFLLSDEVSHIQQSYLLKTIQETEKSNVIINNNPTSGPFTLYINQNKNYDIEVIIRKLDGILVYDNIIKNAPSGLILPIDLSGNTRDTYLVVVKYGSTLITKKLILQ